MLLYSSVLLGTRTQLFTLALEPSDADTENDLLQPPPSFAHNRKRAGKHRCTSTTSVRCFRIETKGHQKPGRSTRMTPLDWQPRVWTVLSALSQILEPNSEANRPTNSSKKVVYTVRKKTAPRQQGKLDAPNPRESKKMKSSSNSARNSKSRRHVCIRIKTTKKKTDRTQET